MQKYLKNILLKKVQFSQISVLLRIFSVKMKCFFMKLFVSPNNLTNFFLSLFALLLLWMRPLCSASYSK